MTWLYILAGAILFDAAFVAVLVRRGHLRDAAIRHLRGEG